MSIEAFISQGDKIRDIDIFFDECFEEAVGVIYGWEVGMHNHQRDGLVKAFELMAPEVVTELVNRGVDTAGFHKALELVDRFPERFALAWAELKAQLLAILDRGDQSQPATSPHPYKLYFDQYCRDNPKVRWKEAEAAKAFYRTKATKDQKKDFTEKSFVRHFKYYLT